jgi:predicted Rossmann-fold nucleotide-binding protein
MHNPPTSHPVIYIPGMPSLSSTDLTLYNTIHDARIDLVTQLDSNGFYVEDIDGANSWLKNMLSYAARSDGFLFPPMTSLPEGHPRYKAETAQRWFEFFSLVTGVHIGNREKYGKEGISKPCVVIDADGGWQLAVELLHDLREKGMFTSRVEDIIQLVSGDTQDFHALNRRAVEILRDALEQGKGKAHKEVTPFYPAEHRFDPFRSEGARHPFGVAIFGSATTPEESYKTQVHHLARLSALRGWRMTTGAGTMGCMGAADEGFNDGKIAFNKEHPDAPFKPAHVGVSTQYILRLEGPPKYLDQLIITDHIYDRMEVMIRGQKSSDPRSRARDASKVFFVVPGGTGTLHEFATLMQLATNGGMMKDRKVVLLNVASHLNPKEGFWGKLIDTAHKLGFAELFDIAHTPEEAISLADAHYQEWLAIRPEYKDLPRAI